jgi:hypothetical protein
LQVSMPTSAFSCPIRTHTVPVVHEIFLSREAELRFIS